MKRLIVLVVVIFTSIFLSINCNADEWMVEWTEPYIVTDTPYDFGTDKLKQINKAYGTSVEKTLNIGSKKASMLFSTEAEADEFISAMPKCHQWSTNTDFCFSPKKIKKDKE